jgi:hypothetical protein
MTIEANGPKGMFRVKIKSKVRKTANKIIVLSITSNSCFCRLLEVVVTWELSF